MATITIHLETPGTPFKRDLDNALQLALEALGATSWFAVSNPPAIDPMLATTMVETEDGLVEVRRDQALPT